MNSGTNKKLALAAMIFAVSMTFIDQTIVAIAVPDLQKDLHLQRPACSGSSTATCSRSRRCSRSAAGSPTSPATGAWC